MVSMRIRLLLSTQVLNCPTMMMATQTPPCPRRRVPTTVEDLGTPRHPQTQTCQGVTRPTRRGERRTRTDSP